MKLFQTPEEILTDPSVIFVPLFGLFILIELYLTHKHNQEDVYNDAKDTFTNLGMGVGSLVVGVFTKAIEFIIYSFFNQYALFHIEISQWYAWLILLFADDFVYYWFHRMAHEVRFFWGSHSVHHSSEKYNFAVALRQTWIDPFYNFIFWIPLAIIGFPAMMMLTMKSAAKIYGFFCHTTTVKKLGFLEYFMCTPSHHRVHHAVNVKYLDRNHGNIFIIWDKLFGTFQEELDNEPPVYGLTENIKSYNLLNVVSREYTALLKDVKRAPDFKTKIKYLFMPPGWTHNGELKTSAELRRKMDIRQ